MLRIGLVLVCNSEVVHHQRKPCVGVEMLEKTRSVLAWDVIVGCEHVDKLLLSEQAGLRETVDAAGDLYCDVVCARFDEVYTVPEV